MTFKNIISLGYRVLYNAFFDQKFGSLLGGKIESQHEHLGSRHIENSDYLALNQIFKGRIRTNDVLVDVGCGKGRVINWWLLNGYEDNLIFGLELEIEVFNQVVKRLADYPNVKLILGNAIENLPAEGTCFYLYNPFEEFVMKQFAAWVKEYIPAEKDPTILYYNCKYVKVFEEGSDWKVTLVDLDASPFFTFDKLAVIKYRTSSNR